LIVLRTFSKWAGLAGLRIGYGFFPVDIANYLMKIKQPYNANAAAQAGVLASLADIEYLRANVARIVMERERLFGKLKELDWLRPYPSSGNFILCSLRKGEAREIWQQLRQKGIFARYFDTPLLKDCLRISVGRPEDTDALVEALKEVKHG
jgi:histidinol-phosphate aminotransferase